MINHSQDSYKLLKDKSTKYALVMPCWNEGNKLISHLKELQQLGNLVDVILADSHSSDGSTDLELLTSYDVYAIIYVSELGLGRAIQSGISLALENNFEGVITVDCNGKDNIKQLKDFIYYLDQGYDFIQGSRFLPGGSHDNTPLLRYLGIRLVISPLLSFSAKFHFTDATNGFKGLGAKFLTATHLNLFNPELRQFNFQFYLNASANPKNFKVIEIPVDRRYPKGGAIPTKIKGLKRHLVLILELLKTVIGCYNEKR